MTTMNNGIQTLIGYQGCLNVNKEDNMDKDFACSKGPRVKGVVTGGIQCQQTRFKKLTAIVQA